MRRAAHASAAVTALAVSVALAGPAAADDVIRPDVGEPATSVTDEGPVGPEEAAPVTEPEVTELEVDGVHTEALGTLELDVEHDHEHEGEGTGEHDHEAGTATEDGTDGLAVLTEEASTDAYDVMGVTWDDTDAEVERVLVRTRSDGDWTDWVELGVTDDGPDPDSAEGRRARAGTEPLVAAASDGVQVRVQTADGSRPDGVRVVLVDGGDSAAETGGAETAAVGGTATASVAGNAVVRTALYDEPGHEASTGAARQLGVANGAAVGTVAGASVRPTVVTRSQWGADESIRGPIDSSSTVKAMVVHHTVNANSYSRAQAPSIVRGIYQYHVKGRGWSDVGYHFLVDRFGTVYEGRYGSMTRVPLGAHTGGFNTDTMGVAAIGDFTKVAPPTALLDGIASVLAWKLGEYGRDPYGTAPATAGSGSTHPTRRPGWSGRISVISGHRDLASTACPGGHLYAQLGTIRAKAAGLIDAASSRIAPASAPHAAGPIAASLATTTGSTWSVEIRRLCSSHVVRRYAGTARSTRTTVAWDLRTSAGTTAAPGLYEMRISRVAGGGRIAERQWVEILPTAGSPPATCGVERLGGADRYETAVALGRRAYPTSADVVLVNGTPDSVVDGLVAAPFAASLEAPVLLTRADALPEVTRAEIARRGKPRVWLVGGTGVLTGRLADELRRMGAQVERVAGDDRYGTAAALARRMGRTSEVVLASGMPANLIDAAAVSGPASATGLPILLTRTHDLPSATRSAVAALGARQAVVVGGTGVVSTSATGEARSAGVRSMSRYGGANRYDTSAAVAQGFAGRVGASEVMLASGASSSLIDSLAGGVLGQVTLLTDGERVAPSVLAVVTRHDVRRLTVSGGAGVVPPAAVGTVATAAGMRGW